MLPLSSKDALRRLDGVKEAAALLPVPKSVDDHLFAAQAHPTRSRGHKPHGRVGDRARGVRPPFRLIQHH